MKTKSLNEKKLSVVLMASGPLFSLGRCQLSRHILDDMKGQLGIH